MLIAVLGDTHVPYRAKTLPVEAWRAISDVELILHTGDVADPALLDELSEIAPVRCAVGNVDPVSVREWGATDTVELEVGGVRVAMLHDSGSAAGRPGRLRRAFPDAQVVCFGHSHMPLVEQHDDLLLLNPGSPTDRRRAPTFTVALLEIADGRAAARLVELD
ncbi:MAG TPA: metallophosphoesterase family protein [Actinomycetota bacterium]|nr:metallophosphoesterase family protein [Actinomycetota bacterium]